MLPSTTVSSHFKQKKDEAYDLNNSERLLYLTRCQSLLRHWCMGSEGHLFPFAVPHLRYTYYFEDCISLVWI